MLFFNWQTWIITCILLTHLDPFINRLLNTGGTGPKLMAWFWEAHRRPMRRTHNTNTQTRRCYVSAGLTQEGRASSARRDGHSSKLTPRSPDQPHTSQDPALSHHSYSQAQARQKAGNGWKETVLLPAIHQQDLLPVIHQQWKWPALGLSGRTAAARREGQSSWPYSAYQ